MRFCPFCSAENADEQMTCAACSRRLPPLPPRHRNAPSTGIQLPQRPNAAPPPRRTGITTSPVVTPASGLYPTGASAPLSGPTPGPSENPQASDPFASAPAPTAAAAPVEQPPRGLYPTASSGPHPAPLSPEATHAPSGRPSSATKPPPLTTTAPYPAQRAASTTSPPPLPRPDATVVTPVRPSTIPPPLATRRTGTTIPPIVSASSPRIAVPPSDDASAKIPTLDDDAVSLATPESSVRPPLPQIKPVGRSSAAIAVPVEALAVARTSSPSIAPTLGGVMVSPGAQHARPGSHAELGPPPPREPAGDDSRRSLLSAISPGPAAARREAAPAAPRDPAGRRSSDGPPRTQLPTPATNVVPPSAFGDDFNTSADASAYDPLTIAAQRPARATGATPPPTRITELHDDRPFQPPQVSPVPEIPEPGIYRSARYTIRFWRARWQRRGAIRTLQAEIKQDTDALDQVLGALGKVARQARVEGRVFSAENAAIDKAEERMGVLAREHGDVDGRKAEEVSRFIDIERERNARLAEAERMVAEHQGEASNLEGQRRGMRDKRKELERRQKAYLKAAEDNDKQSASSTMGDQRADLRRSAEQHRREAAALEPDRQEVDRRLAALEKPIAEATAKLETSKAELETAKRSLADAREGHTHRLAELDAEQKRKAREIASAESEVSRRLVTLGTLVNLNRIDDPVFAELYQRIDRLRGAITARTTEIEKLTAEREAYDRGTLVRGVAVIGGAIVALIALIAILRAIV